MHAERLEIEDDAGEWAELRAGFLDLIIADRADADALGGAAGRIEGTVDLLLCEAELDEGPGERWTVLDEAAVEAEHADVAGDGQFFAVAVEDGTTDGALDGALEFTAIDHVGVEGRWFPVDDPAAWGREEVKRCGVFEVAEIGCSGPHGEPRAPGLGGFDRRGQRDERQLGREARKGGGEQFGWIGPLGFLRQEQVERIGIAIRPCRRVLRGSRSW